MTFTEITNSYSTDDDYCINIRTISREVKSIIDIDSGPKPSLARITPHLSLEVVHGLVGIECEHCQQGSEHGETLVDSGCDRAWKGEGNE